MEFPNIDPIAPQIGPITIRWYALSYITGLLFGWRLACIYLTRFPPKAVTPPQLDDFWYGRPSGSSSAAALVTWSLSAALLSGTPARDPPDVERRHVFPWRAAGLDPGRLYFRPTSFDTDTAAVRSDFRRRSHRPLFRAVANFINGELWGRTTDVSWGIIFPRGGLLPRHPSQLYEAVLEGLVLVVLAYVLIRRIEALRRPGMIFEPSWRVTASRGSSPRRSASRTPGYRTDRRDDLGAMARFR